MLSSCILHCLYYIVQQAGGIEKHNYNQSMANYSHWDVDCQKKKTAFIMGKGMCCTQPHCIQVWMLEHCRQSRRVKTYLKVSIHLSAFQTTLDDKRLGVAVSAGLNLLVSRKRTQQVSSASWNGAICTVGLCAVLLVGGPVRPAVPNQWNCQPGRAGFKAAISAIDRNVCLNGRYTKPWRMLIQIDTTLKCPHCT